MLVMLMVVAAGRKAGGLGSSIRLRPQGGQEHLVLSNSVNFVGSVQAVGAEQPGPGEPCGCNCGLECHCCYCRPGVSMADAAVELAGA